MAAMSMPNFDSVAPDVMAPADNILLDYSTKDVPTNIKELFSMMEFLSFNSGQVFSAIKKLTEFPITRPVFKTDNPKLKKRHEEIAKHAKYKSQTLAVGLDYNTYGNSITSVYRPIVRYILCKNPGCNAKVRLRDASFRYTPKDDAFFLNKCPSCGWAGRTDVEDHKDLSEKKVNIIRWDIKQIDIEYNNFSGESSYYYYMSEDERRKIRDNHIELLTTYPRRMLALAGKDKSFRFKFAPHFIYHMKTPCLSGISKVWGFPPSTPALKSFFYQMMLRKSNEAIAYDYLNHLRVIYPAMSQAENNPLQYINMSVWADEMSSTIKKWRQDRNFIKLSPHPIGYQTVGGEGRGMLLTNEVREASYDILLTLGIPRELMEGSTAQNMATPVLLRIVENMMLTYMEQLTDWLNWVDKQNSDWFGIEEVTIEFTPFKFIDDIQRKQILMQWGQGGESKKISDDTIADQLDLDLEEEQDKIVEDSIREYKLQKKIQSKIQELETSLAAQAEQQASASSGQGANYNNAQQTIAQADQIAQQLAQVPYEQRKSELLALQKEDYIIYSVVVQRLEELNNQMKNSAASSAKMASLGGQYPNGLIKEATVDLKALDKKLNWLISQVGGTDATTP
jgi:hypothetical protein